jgi:anaerobic ribonucleoside-triphosphate reductase activating protein
VQLKVAQIIPDTEAEGPGRRFALWVQGCAIRCPGCCNPEMFGTEGGRLSDSAELAKQALATAGIEGVSVLGGEPCEQPEAVADFCERIKAGGLSVMVYSGYTLDELRAKKSPHIDRILASADLLADGRYDNALPETKRRWLGSTNQTLHFFTARYSPDDPRFSTANTVELRLSKDGLTVNGWPGGAKGLEGLRAFRRRQVR